MRNTGTCDAVRFEDIVAESAVMKSLLAKARQVSRAGLRAILQGPTGTGKELFARAIHFGGARSQHPFFPVNCGAIPETLAESELFGHEKGAFTGADRRRRGSFEMAHRGTLFLDEVTSLPFELQAKLLRVLQDGRFLRMGGEEWVGVDLQILAATNRDIRAEVKAGRFREDLFYRLGVTLLEIPPLMDRRVDVATLLRHFLGIWSAKCGKTLRGFSRAAWEFLQAYAWPGNVRQLEMVIERLVALEEGDEIDLAHFPSDILELGSPVLAQSPSSMTHAQHRHIVKVLEECSWNRSRAAKALGISRPTLRSKMDEYGIVGPGSRDLPNKAVFRALPATKLGNAPDGAIS